ncbi:alpha/beta fold hydrolase [Mesorhizobium japonicum]|uniref:alpha/beta fold hydrolase n=1 Tax=Mesorhizobium japonicum TaxID=2066070 RepID=UPI003B5A48AF
MSDSDIRFLTRPEGRLAYTVEGSGPLVIAAPGMGDLRSTYRELAPALVAAGFRVGVLDIRGHGDSDTTFRHHGDAALAGDLLALVDELGGPALLVGNSFAGSAAVIAAATRPEAVSGLALVSPFLHQRSTGVPLALTRLLFGLLFARPWGAGAWAGYYGGTLNRGRHATGHDDHVAEIRSSLADPRRLAAFRALTFQLDHREVEPFAARVEAPAFIAVGALDPDYPDPAAELRRMGEQLHAETLLVDEAAHYAHAQRADIVVPAIVDFAVRVREERAARA